MEKFPILYVDDEAHNLTSFVATFRKEYKIHTATSGNDALEIMRNNEIKLVITDQRMPEMTGIQLLEKLSPEFPDSVRMILTGFSDIEVIIDDMVYVGKEIRAKDKEAALKIMSIMSGGEVTTQSEIIHLQERMVH